MKTPSKQLSVTWRLWIARLHYATLLFMCFGQAALLPLALLQAAATWLVWLPANLLQRCGHPLPIEMTDQVLLMSKAVRRRMVIDAMELVTIEGETQPRIIHALRKTYGNDPATWLAVISGKPERALLK